MKYRRINIHGGPGIGKSALVCRLFSELKARDFNIEHVNEYVKIWAYINRVPTKFDQVYLFSKQMHDEITFLNNGADFIITDSSVLGAISYARKYGSTNTSDLLSIYNDYEQTYPSININLYRDNSYNEIGRYESYEEAISMDKLIAEDIEMSCINNIIEFQRDQIDMILAHIMKEIKYNGN